MGMIYTCECTCYETKQSTAEEELIKNINRHLFKKGTLYSIRNTKSKKIDEGLYQYYEYVFQFEVDTLLTKEELCHVLRNIGKNFVIK